MSDVRILIIHRNCLFREGLAFVLAQQPNMMVAGVFASVSEMLQDTETLRPDVVVLDLYLPDREGLREARLIKGLFPEIRILMTGLSELESDVLACIEAGAAGYLVHEASLEDLLNNIQAVAAGEALCSPKVAGMLFSRIAEAGRERELRHALGLPNLTRRELEIIGLIEEGFSNEEIAAQWQIEVQTLKNHIHNNLDKLRPNGRRGVEVYDREQRLPGD